MSIDFELAQIEASMIADSQTVSAPLFLHMLGIPGSGKSSFLNILKYTWAQHNKERATLLGFDQVMQSIPSYQAMGDKVAGFAAYEIPARMAGYRILNGLLQKRTHIFFDNGGSAESHPDFLRKAKGELGYRLVFVSISTPIEVARARVDVRAVKAGQHTPLHYLEEREEKLQRLIPDYQQMADGFYILQNDGADMGLFQQKAQDIALGLCKFAKSEA